MKKLLLFSGALLLLLCVSCSSEESKFLEQSKNHKVEFKLYSDYLTRAAYNSNELIGLLNVGSITSRNEDLSLLSYLLSLSDEQLDSLKVIYPVTEGNDFETRYDNTVDSLIANYPLDVVSNFISVISAYFEMGGHNTTYIFSQIDNLPELFKNMTIGVAAYYDEYTNGVELNPSRSFSCVDKLAIDLGGMLFVDVVDAAMGGAIGGPIGEGFAIVGINTTDLVAIVDALAKYRWCKRTGVFL